MPSTYIVLGIWKNNVQKKNKSNGPNENGPSTKKNEKNDFILSSHKIKIQSHVQLDVSSNHNEQLWI